MPPKTLRAPPSRQFDVVLTDLRLPGMDGEALIRTMEERWPELATRDSHERALHTPAFGRALPAEAVQPQPARRGDRQVADRSIASRSKVERAR
jgi:CheY-like chemotaxis protein